MPPHKSKLPDGIESLPVTRWENCHQNFVHTFKRNASFKLRIPTGNDPQKQYHDTTKNFQWLIKHAIENNLSMRAMGNGWSFSDVAVCNGGLIDTKALRLSFNLNNSFVHPAYLQNGNSATDLFFVECGMSILDINEKLEQASNPKRSLKASGASNGQSMAGCISTGTHGSAFNVGAVHDTVVGLHVITSADKHVWIERKSKPVASDKMIEWLGAEAVRDDDIFNAVVVGFGSFGFIHGIMIETEPVFLLEQFRSGNIMYNDALKKAINTLDFSQIETLLPFALNTPDKELYHFEVIVNLQEFEPDNPEKGVYLKTMYKMPYTENRVIKPRDDKGLTYGDDLLGVIQKVIDGLGTGLSTVLLPKLVKQLFPLAFSAQESTVGTIGETFCNTKFRGKAASAAIGINASDASKTIEEIVQINKTLPFPGGVALRYVKGTDALLGFTHFPKTCILELDGVDSEMSRNFFKKIWNRLEALSIPYTLHWGKINFNLTPELITKMYGTEKVKQWKQCRAALLQEKERKVFNNDFIWRCGLAE